MSFTIAVALIATLDALVIAAVAAVCRIPFRLDREPSSLSRAPRIDLGSPELAAA
jgi:hypothetical protein